MYRGSPTYAVFTTADPTKPQFLAYVLASGGFSYFHIDNRLIIGYFRKFQINNQKTEAVLAILMNHCFWTISLNFEFLYQNVSYYFKSFN